MDEPNLKHTPESPQKDKPKWLVEGDPKIKGLILILDDVENRTGKKLNQIEKKIEAAIKLLKDSGYKVEPPSLGDPQFSTRRQKLLIESLPGHLRSKKEYIITVILIVVILIGILMEWQ